MQFVGANMQQPMMGGAPFSALPPGVRSEANGTFTLSNSSGRGGTKCCSFLGILVFLIGIGMLGVAASGVKIFCTSTPPPAEYNNATLVKHSVQTHHFGALRSRRSRSYRSSGTGCPYKTSAGPTVYIGFAAMAVVGAGILFIKVYETTFDDSAKRISFKGQRLAQSCAGKGSEIASIGYSEVSRVDIVNSSGCQFSSGRARGGALYDMNVSNASGGTPRNIAKFRGPPMLNSMTLGVTWLPWLQERFGPTVQVFGPDGQMAQQPMAPVPQPGIMMPGQQPMMMPGQQQPVGQPMNAYPQQQYQPQQQQQQPQQQAMPAPQQNYNQGSPQQHQQQSLY